MARHMVVPSYKTIRGEKNIRLAVPEKVYRVGEISVRAIRLAQHAAQLRGDLTPARLGCVTIIFGLHVELAFGLLCHEIGPHKRV